MWSELSGAGSPVIFTIRETKQVSPSPELEHSPLSPIVDEEKLPLAVGWLKSVERPAKNVAQEPSPHRVESPSSHKLSASSLNSCRPIQRMAPETLGERFADEHAGAAQGDRDVQADGPVSC